MALGTANTTNPDNRREIPVHDARPRSARPLAWVIGILALIAVLAVLWNVGNDPGREDVASVAPADVFETPSAYLGRNVTLRGRVQSVLEPNAFTIGGDEAGEQILIIGRTSTPVTENAIVRVSGTVREFSRDTISREAGLDLDADRYADWAGRPSVLANEVTPIASE